MKQNLGAVTWMAAGRMSAPLLIMGASIWMLSGIVDPTQLSGLPEAITALPIHLLAISAAFCAVSLWAVARYDGLAHRHFQTGVREALARKSGFAAIAVAQTVGFGALSGAAVRWRMLPDLGMVRALQLSTYVSVTFMAALILLGAIACIVLPTPQWLFLPAASVVVILPALILTISFAPSCAPLRHRIQIPSLRSIGAILGWSGLDLMAATLALYLLIPTTDLSFATFLPVFILALGAAMLSGAPGGVGPFELTLISLLPQVDTADLICAIVAFRALYYAVPAGLAVAVIFTTKRLKKRLKTAALAQPALTTENNAELGILAQNGGTVIAHQSGSYALWYTNQTATMLFDPVSGPSAPALKDLKERAKAQNRLACIYKCGSRVAATARQNGWRVVRVAFDCVVSVGDYDLNLPARRGLRRKLRKAAQSGVTVKHAAVLPLGEMAALDAIWQNEQGTARGATMGRYCPEYLREQDVFLAHKDGRLVAFVSFHSDKSSLCLDLMRHVPSLPDGSMHLLVQTAITFAQATGKSHVSLAAVPDMPKWAIRTKWLRQRLTNPGLAQFKNSFAPQHHPRYAAAPSATAFALALADITTEVHVPRPLPGLRPPHNQDEDYELALRKPAWNGLGQSLKTGI